MSDDAARRERAEERAARMTIRRVPRDAPDELGPFGGEALALTCALTRSVWALRGEPWPNLPRSEWPVRLCPLDAKNE